MERKAITQAAKATGANRQYVADARAIKNEAPALFEEVKAGGKTIPEAKRELRIQKEADVAQLVGNALMADPEAEARIQRAETKAEFSKAVKWARDRWLLIDPMEVAAILTGTDVDFGRSFSRDARRWLDLFDAETERNGTLRVVG